MKKVLSLLLCSLITVSSMAMPKALADDFNTDDYTEEELELLVEIEEKQEEINSTLDELALITAKRLSHEQGTSKLKYSELSELDALEAELEDKLLELGVNSLSNDEVDELREAEMDILYPDTQSTTPPSTSSVYWRDYVQTVSRGGKNYTVKQIYAQGKTASSNLTAGSGGNGSMQRLYTNREVAFNAGRTAGYYAASTAAGLIPYIGIPAQALIDSIADKPKPVNEMYEVGYNQVSTVCFIYVKPSGSSNSNYKLSYISNSSSTASTHRTSGYYTVGNGTSGYSRSKDRSNITSASGYASPSNAIDGYLYGYRDSFLTQVRFTDETKSRSVRSSLANPRSMAAVY